MNKVIFSVLIILMTWLIISYVFQPAQYLFPSLNSVARDFLENTDMYMTNTIYTLIEVVIGFIIANILGIIIAIVAIYYSRIEQVLTMSAIMLKTVPIIAIAPLLVLWFGHGIWSKVAAVAITCFIPIFINLVSGAKTVICDYKDVINLYNVTKYQKLIHFILPGVAPYLISAFKISSSLAIVGALVSEFISANKGLGYLIISNYYSMNIAGVFVCIILSSIMGITIYYACEYVQKKYVMW